MKMLYDKDANVDLIKSKKIAIFGFGSQGHAHAMNLKDSGVKNIVIGLKKNSSSINKAKKAGFTVLSSEKAIEYGEVVIILIPDELQPELYKKIIKKKIAKNAYLGFAHGFSIHFKFIKPRKDLNIFMVAPKGPGHLVRSEYKNKRGVPCLLAIEKSVSNDTKNIGLSYASAIGGGKTGIIETTFREECETDLQSIEEEIIKIMTPKDEADDGGVILEVRAGTGNVKAS